jgi:uncharacterized membrane protein YgcG
MILDLLRLPFRLVSVLVSIVFTVGILEALGFVFYMQWQNPQALQRLMSDGVTPARVLEFVLASPDRMLVAGGLAVVGVVMALNSGSGTTHVADGDGFDDGGFGGGFGGDGGGGDGGGGGGGGE